jgi:4-hydroxybenzoate polyprenyltransferase
MKQTGQILQALSVDVAFGAVCCSAMFCRLTGLTPLPWAQLLILGGTVLLIYTADHQADVHRMEREPVTRRHRFHWRYRHVLRPLALALAIFLAAAAFLLLNTSLLRFGLVLAGAVVAYLVLQNLMLFSYQEWEDDVSQGQRSLARSWGKNTVRRGLYLIIAVLVVLLLISFRFAGESGMAVWVTLACMALVLAGLCLFPSSFRRNGLYRWLGDGVFLLAAWSLSGA